MDKEEKMQGIPVRGQGSTHSALGSPGLLFIHNTLPEFRVCFFEGLSDKYPTRFLITHPNLASDIYGSDGNSQNSLNIRFLNCSLTERLKAIKQEIEKDGISKIIMPPADSIQEIIEGLYALRAAEKRGLDVYTWTEKWEAPISEQSLKKRIKNAAHRLILTRYAKAAKRVIVFGSKAKEYMLDGGISENKIRVSYMMSLPPACNSEVNIRKMYGISDDKKIIFNLARMIPRKGLDVLIDAVRIINKKHNDFVLLVGGDGSMKPVIESKIKEYRLDNVILAGYVDASIRTKYYEQSDLFVLPSKYYKGMIDGWGLPVNEALLCGTPVVATTCEGSAYDLLDGTNGVMVEQNNAEALADGIEHMLYDVSREDAKAACIRTDEKFSLENMVTSFIDAITE